MYELTPVDRDELAAEGSGTKLRAEGNLVYFMQKIKCEIDYYVNHWPGPFRGRWGDSLFYAEENKMWNLFIMSTTDQAPFEVAEGTSLFAKFKYGNWNLI